MIELEKVEKGIECCTNDVDDPYACQECPYLGHKPTRDGCIKLMLLDALDLLKEQEPRVMPPYEARAEYEIVWLDRKNISCEVAILQRIACSMYEFSIMGTDEMPRLLESQYGKTWRCWTSRPADEQRKAVKWDE